MGILHGKPLGPPGNLGLNTQDSPIGLPPQYATDAYNCIIDEEGRLAARKGFVALGSAAAYLAGTPAKVCFQHYLLDGTNDTIYAGNGYILYDRNTPTMILDYAKGSQIVDVGGAKLSSSATGLLNDATSYTATATIDGTPVAIAVTGSAAQTYATLLSEINTDLGAAGTAILYGGNIKIISATTGASSTVSLADSGANHLFSSLTGYVSIQTAHAGDVLTNNYQFASLNGMLYAANSAYDLMGWDETNADYGALQTLSHSAFVNPNTIMAAYGRLWAADVQGDDYTVYWSVLGDGTDFNSAGSGSINLTTVFVDGKDSIVALGAHNNRLIIFCRKSVYIFKLPADLDPASMTLEDTIQHVGCISRDSVVSTGDDIIWLAGHGVQSLKRRVTYDMLPFTDLSAKVHQNMINRFITVANMDEVRAFYYPRQGWYLISCPQTSVVWVFHMSEITEAGYPKITQWNDPTKTFYGFVTTPDGELYASSTDGMYQYTGYGSAASPYTMRYSSGWLPLDDAASLKHFKKVLVTIRGGSGQQGTLAYGKDFKDTWKYTQFTLGSEATASEYGVSEYNDIDDIGVLYGGVGPGTVTFPDDFVLAAFYTEGALVEDKYLNIGGSGKFIRFRVELDIKGEVVSLYNMTSFDTRGKTR